MLVSIGIGPSEGYEVSVFVRDEQGYGRWHEMREFLYQGDAIQFAYEDCPKFSDCDIKCFIKTRKYGSVYRRQGYKKYREVKDIE